MNERLKELIRVKAKGRQVLFAEMMGWKPQYITSLLRSDELGSKPLREILKVFPDVNARWLVLGEGRMLGNAEPDELLQDALDHMAAIIELEQYIPVMTMTEQAALSMCLHSHESPIFCNETRERWAAEMERIDRKAQERDERIEDAMKRSMELCSQRKARK